MSESIRMLLTLFGTVHVWLNEDYCLVLEGYNAKTGDAIEALCFMKGVVDKWRKIN